MEMVCWTGAAREWVPQDSGIMVATRTFIETRTGLQFQDPNKVKIVKSLEASG